MPIDRLRDFLAPVRLVLRRLGAARCFAYYRCPVLAGPARTLLAQTDHGRATVLHHGAAGGGASTDSFLHRSSRLLLQSLAAARGKWLRDHVPDE